ncbi:MAG TPA: (Fe-S)-binding protein, partial [Bacteroidia bacterium]|nr:(Fe-S)-binding protein [Bacteroidia bacterium]
IYEFSDFLINVMNVSDVGAKLSGVATYHDACNAFRELKIKEAPRILLSKVRGLTLKEMSESEMCCGFGGTFAGKYEQIAAALAEEKTNRAVKTGAEYIISTDMGCLMHLEGYLKKNKISLKVIHIADVLANF